MRAGFGSHKSILLHSIQKQRARGKGVGKGVSEGKLRKRGSPSAFDGFYYPAPFPRFAL